MQSLTDMTRRQWNGMFMLILFVVGVWLVPTLHLDDCDAALDSVAQSDETASHSDLGSDDEHQSHETDEHPEHCPICRVKSLCLAIAAMALLPCISSISIEGVPAGAGRIEVDPPIHYFLARGPPVRA